MTSDLAALNLDDDTWQHYNTIEPYTFENKWLIPGLRGDFYMRNVGDVLQSYGTFTFKGSPTHRAWGVKTELHCSHHAIYTNGEWSAVIEGCPQLSPIYDSHESITGFILETPEGTFRFE